MFSDFTPSKPAKFISDQEVHLWLVDVADTYEKNVMSQLQSYLSEDEKLRMAGFRKPESQHRFLTARGALRLILAGLQMASLPADMQFSVNDHGKPFLTANPENLHFNLSHSGDMILIAMTRGRECGVDIERMDSARNFNELADFYFHPSERDVISAAKGDADIMHRFYTLWSLKEAFIKAEGKGMAIAGDSFYFSGIDSLQPEVVTTAGSQTSGRHWLFSCELYRQDYSMALAVEKINERDITVKRQRLVFD